MNLNAALQCGLFLAVLTALAVPLGNFMARVYEGQTGLLGRVFGPVERLFYRAAGVREDDDMTWQRYALSVLAFSLASTLLVYGLQRLQAHLPWNPEGVAAVPPEVSFNTAVSFATNTNWQAYGGETTMSYFTQMLALTVQNFVSAAAGMAVLVATVAAS